MQDSSGVLDTPRTQPRRFGRLAIHATLLLGLSLAISPVRAQVTLDQFPGVDIGAQIICQGNASTHTLQCAYNNGPFLALPQLVASGTSTLGTAAIATTHCASALTTAASGVAATDTILWSLNASATGYTSAAGSGLTIQAVPTTGNVTFYVCNPTPGSITPGPATLNWKVVR